MKSNKSAIFALILASIIWGATGPVMKQTLETVPIFSLAFIRFGVASIILLPFVLNKLKIKKEDLLPLFLSAILGVTLNITFFFWGLTLTTAINSGIIVASTPIFTLLICSLLLKEKIKKNYVLGALLGIGGIGIIIGQDILKQGLNLSPFGDFLILMAVLAFIFYEIVSKKLFKKYHPLTITFYSFLIGSFSFLPASISEYQVGHSWISNLSIESITGILYGIFLSSLAAYTLWQWGLSKMSEAKVGFFFYLDPVASTIAAVVILSEKITLPFVLGSIFIFLGLLLAETNFPYKRILSKFNLSQNSKKVLEVANN